MVNNFSEKTRLIVHFLMQIKSIFNCYYFPIENGVSRIVC